MAVGIVAEIKGRLPVADVVGETVQLRKAGTTLKGLCPFHGEKTPSFVVTPGRDTWHCFGCGKHGDIFTFVMERDGLGFPGGAEGRSPGRAGVELDERTKREDAHNARLREVMEGAIAFYHAVLMHSKPGEPALAYLRGRGLHRRDHRAAPAGLGARRAGTSSSASSPRSARCPRPSSSRSAWPARASAAAASTTGSASGSSSRSATRTGIPSGLGGRVLGKEGVGEDGRDHGPKYLNSPATPLFDKSRTLYLIDRAKSRDPQERPGGHRRGLHRRADGPPGGLRQRGRLASAPRSRPGRSR